MNYDATRKRFTLALETVNEPEAAKIREQLKIPLETFAEKVRPFFARDLADNNPNTGWKMTLRFIAPYL